MRKTQLLTLGKIIVSILIMGCNGTSEQGLRVVDNLDPEIIEIIKHRYTVLFPEQLSSIDVDIIDSEGNSYISYAIEYESMFVLTQLINANMSLAVLDVNGSELLEQAFDKSYLGIGNIIMEYLQEKNLPYESAIYNSFYKAIRAKNEQLAEYLMGLINTIQSEVALDPNMFFYVTEFRTTNYMEYLLTIGYDVNLVDEKGWNGLFYTLNRGRDTQIIEYLIENGIAVDHVSNDGETPLLLVSKRPLTDFYIKILLDNGANVNYVDPKGKTALDYARKVYGNEYSASILEEHGALTGEEVRAQS